MFSNLGRAVFGATPSHLHPLQCVLIVLECFAWFHGEDRLGACEPQFAPPSVPMQYTLVSESQRREFPIQREREREEFPTSGEYTGLFPSLVQYPVLR